MSFSLEICVCVEKDAHRGQLLYMLLLHLFVLKTLGCGLCGLSLKKNEVGRV